MIRKELFQKRDYKYTLYECMELIRGLACEILSTERDRIVKEIEENDNFPSKNTRSSKNGVAKGKK